MRSEGLESPGAWQGISQPKLSSLPPDPLTLWCPRALTGQPGAQDASAVPAVGQSQATVTAG